MCTVSFVPVGNKVIITSNRDEKLVRPAAIPPQQVQTHNGMLFYPVDAKAGGTWFIVNDKGDAGVLLNGAYKKHLPKEQYLYSRGSILPALFDSEDPYETLKDFDFEGIENCTLVLYLNKHLYECVWDGMEAVITMLSTTQCYIWSSVTLYNTEMITARKQWFKEFIASNLSPNQEEMIHFHTNTGKGNTVFGLKMNRDNAMLTVSITSVSISEESSVLQYMDCLQDKHVTNIIENNLIVK